MDFIVKDLDNNYRLDAFRNKADKIIFEISSEISTANCPYCGKNLKEFILDIKERYRIFPYKERRLFYLFQQESSFVIMIRVANGHFLNDIHLLMQMERKPNV